MTTRPADSAAPVTTVDVWDYWRRQLTARRVDPELPWRDADVMTVIRDLVTTHDAEAEAAAAAVSAREGLDVKRLRSAIYVVSVRHDWANTVDTDDRTEEIAREYRLLSEKPEADR